MWVQYKVNQTFGNSSFLSTSSLDNPLCFLSVMFSLVSMRLISSIPETFRFLTKQRAIEERQQQNKIRQNRIEKGNKEKKISIQYLLIKRLSSFILCIKQKEIISVTSEFTINLLTNHRRFISKDKKIYRYLKYIELPEVKTFLCSK